MKVIIAGSRNYTVYQTVLDHVDRIVCAHNMVIDEIVSGGARGVDALGERYARDHNIPCKRFPANWDRYGRSAGPRRNRDMAEYGDMLIAFTSGGPGTENMIRQMQTVQKPVVIIQI